MINAALFHNSSPQVCPCNFIDQLRHRLFQVKVYDDVGKISAIEKERTNEVEVSFVQSGQNRSNFNEDLLNSSGSIQNNGPGSGEFELKSRGVGSDLRINQDLEVTIDIDWPAERIEEEYRKQ